MVIIETLLGLSALYSAGMWLHLAIQSMRYGLDYERETFHLGLCCILAIGFLGLILRGG